eukprot:5784304-Pleurochrysis_carterae.AAC.1
MAAVQVQQPNCRRRVESCKMHTFRQCFAHVQTLFRIASVSCVCVLDGIPLVPMQSQWDTTCQPHLPNVSARAIQKPRTTGTASCEIRAAIG